MPYIGTSPSNGVRRVHTYTATAGQTNFTGAGSEGATLSYKDTTFVDVFQNGVLLGSADYTATSGTSIVLAQAASVDDLVVIIAYDVFSVADTVSKADGGTFDGNVTMGGTLDVSGAFTSQGIDDNADANAITISSSENVGIGTSSGNEKLDVSGAIRVSASSAGFSSGLEGTILDFDTVNNRGRIGTVAGASGGSRHLTFLTNGTEQAILFNSGTFCVGKLSSAVSTEGVTLFVGGNGGFTKDGGACINTNRLNSDGTMIDFRRENAAKGTITVSGNTVSYNAFTGSHWSRLADNSKPTILRGTVIETIDEMCDWYQVQFTVEPTDGTSSYVEKVNIALPDGASIGDTISYTHEGITYDDAVIIEDEDEKHTKCKISATEDSARVYGVFMDWDNDDDAVNDMYVMAVGTGVVRVSSGETVNAGDLLSSKGDGTAKVQSDDIVRSKTIGKVLTNIKQETYDDGSYTVPCALYCG